jgi:hypothetical protein
MSQLAQKRKSFSLSGMSGLSLEADITPASPYVRFVPTGLLPSQLTQISEVICPSAGALRKPHTLASSSRKPRA